MLELHGLTVDVVEESASAPLRAGADLRWQRLSRDRIPAGPPAEGWAWRALVGEGGVACSFAVSPDGREVVSHTVGPVREAELFGLFAEAVMRTVLRRLGLVSLHGATLAADGRAVMILGRRGAGKSSLSAALALTGWSLVSDDLSRVIERPDGWHVPAGYRRGKLNGDVAAALGYDVAALERRWTSGGSWDAPGNKWVLPQADADAPAEPALAAIYVLGDRSAGAEPLSVMPLAPVGRIGALLSHLSEDPLDGASAPPPATNATLMAIARDVPVLQLSLPDDLTRLRAAAVALSGRHAGATPG